MYMSGYKAVCENHDTKPPSPSPLIKVVPTVPPPNSPSSSSSQPPSPYPFHSSPDSPTPLHRDPAATPPTHRAKQSHPSHTSRAQAVHCGNMPASALYSISLVSPNNPPTSPKKKPTLSTISGKERERKKRKGKQRTSFLTPAIHIIISSLSSIPAASSRRCLSSYPHALLAWAPADLPAPPLLLLLLLLPRL